MFKYLDDINVLDDEDFYTMIQFVSNYGNIGSWNFKSEETPKPKIQPDKKRK